MLARMLLSKTTEPPSPRAYPGEAWLAFNTLKFYELFPGQLQSFSILPLASFVTNSHHQDD